MLIVNTLWLIYAGTMGLETLNSIWVCWSNQLLKMIANIAKETCFCLICLENSYYFIILTNYIVEDIFL